MSNKVKKHKLKMLIFSYGVLPMMLVRDKYANNEDYVNAAIVRDAINEHCKEYNIDAPKEYGVKSKRWLLNQFGKIGMCGTIALSNTESYAEEIINQLNES